MEFQLKYISWVLQIKSHKLLAQILFIYQLTFGEISEWQCQQI